jgi:hypothetical protein
VAKSNVRTREACTAIQLVRLRALIVRLAISVHTVILTTPLERVGTHAHLRPVQLVLGVLRRQKVAIGVLRATNVHSQPNLQ